MYLDLPTLQRGLDALTAAYRRRQQHDGYDFPMSGIRGQVLRALNAIAEAFPGLDVGELKAHLAPGARCDRPTYGPHDDFTALCDLGLGRHLVAPYPHDDERVVVGFLAEAHLALFGCLPTCTQTILGCRRCAEDVHDSAGNTEAPHAIAMAAHLGWLSPSYADTRPTDFRPGKTCTTFGTAHVTWAGASAPALAAHLAPALHEHAGATIDLEGERVTLHVHGNQSRLGPLTTYAHRLAEAHDAVLTSVVFIPTFANTTQRCGAYAQYGFGPEGRGCPQPVGHPGNCGETA